MNDFKQNALALALSCLLVVGLSMLTYQLGYQRGEVQAQDAAQTREAQINADHAAALVRATAREIDTERALQAELATLRTQLSKETQHVQAERARTADAVRSGAVRLSIPALCPGGADGRGAAGPDPAAAARDRSAARAELAPEAGLALAAIADDGDDAIRQLNACIDAYGAVRERINQAALETSNAQAR